jgi:riboflavin synthase
LFTGIVQKVGHVIGAKQDNLVIDSGFTGIALGESIAVNGVCLTVTEFTAKGEVFFSVSPETFARTNLGELAASRDSRVNLERALRADERLSGHLVQGHVDGVGIVSEVSATPNGEYHILAFEIPSELARYCVEKGSICINGVSLTLNSVNGSTVVVMLIPHTWDHTNLSNLKTGDRVNIEVDVLAKYVEKLCQPYRKHP